ncbi:MFS transporter [Actinomadura rubrisoli]|uniref:MFS transporter n=1 Tax=Actinomadura rubrisoli TaxID=2530368 RepID=UPI001404E93C|nr:MFS transporter [Actinomadura rubrisoli]
MTGDLPRAAKALVGVRVLNQLGAYVLAFLAVLAGPDLAAWALGVFGIAALVSRWLGGVLLDRLAPRTVIVLGLTATGAAMLLLAAARGSWLVLAAIALVGLAFELYEPATQESLARITASEHGRRGDVYGLLGTSLVAAGAVGGLLAAVLLPIGVRWLVVVDAVTCLVAAAVALAFLEPEPVRPGASRVGGGGRWRPPGPLVRLTVAGTAFACGCLAVLMFMPFALLQRGAPEWLPGLALTGAALLAPLTGHFGRRILSGLRHEPVLAVGTIVLGLLALTMAAGRAVPLMVAAYLAWAAVDSVLQGRWQAMIAELAPEAERPRWFAFHGSSWGIAQPTVPVLVALAGGAAGGALLTAGGAFLLVPATLAATSPLRRLKGRATEP